MARTFIGRAAPAALDRVLSFGARRAPYAERLREVCSLPCI